jgi:hypothetical protein
VRLKKKRIRQKATRLEQVKAVDEASDLRSTNELRR